MSRRSERSRGFSLAEAMVSLTLLVVVMVVALTLLFTMRSFAERVQWVIEPRQTARRAVDYLAHFLQGATDVGLNAPNAIVTYYNSDGLNPASRVQATYDNLTAAQAAAGFGDEGTDLVSLLLPTGAPAKYLVTYAGSLVWPGYSPPTHDYYIGYREGCGAGNDDNANMTAFKLLTREDGTGHSNALLLLQDNAGAWQYFRITAYVAADAACKCTMGNGANIHIQASPGDSPANGGAIEPPGGHPAGILDPVFLVTGLEAFSFRVRTVNGVPSLEQKTGLFDPTTDNPGAAFVPVIENVEDFQIAYLYTDGTFWQSATASLKTLDATAYPDDVPWQAGPTAAAPARDISQVVGLRFSIVARSRPVTFGARQISAAKTGAAVPADAIRRFRPGVENHAGATTYDDFEHFRATAMLMLKNRMLGS